MNNGATPARLRIDKWLWAARIFRTRSLAAEAVAKHRVQVDGQRIKASRTVQAGDSVTVEKGPYEFELTVLDVDGTRRGAPEAQRLYAESEASIATRRETAARRRADRESRLGIAGQGRPDKRQRRDILRLLDSHGADERDIADAGEQFDAGERDD